MRALVEDNQKVIVIIASVPLVNRDYNTLVFSDLSSIGVRLARDAIIVLSLRW